MDWEMEQMSMTDEQTTQGGRKQMIKDWTTADRRQHKMRKEANKTT